jgi:hypothetical protein
VNGVNDVKDNEIFKLKQELSEVKDLVQEVLRRFGELEFRGNLTYGEPNNISRHNVSFDVKLNRLIKGKLVGDAIMEEKKSWDERSSKWDKLKEIKLDTPIQRVKPNRKPISKAVKHEELKESKVESTKVENVEEFQLMKIDELEWLNLLNEIREGFDAFQNGDFKQDEVREQISSVIFNRVKKWLKNKEL